MYKLYFISLFFLLTSLLKLRKISLLKETTGFVTQSGAIPAKSGLFLERVRESNYRIRW